MARKEKKEDAMDIHDAFKRHVVKYRKGDVIFREGDLGTEMYIIQSGKIRIYKDIDGYDQTLTVLEKGDFFGEMAILEGLPRTATAEAEEDTELIRINSANFVAMIKANPEIAIRIMRKLSLRLRETTDQLQRLMHASTAIFSSLDAPPVSVSEEDKTVEEKGKALAYLISNATGKSYPIVREVTIIGRHDRVTGQSPDIDLTEEDTHRYVSRRHAIILYEDDEFKLIEEIGVVNGTFLNGQRLPNGVPVKLKDGDQVTFANVAMTFTIAPSDV